MGGFGAFPFGTNPFGAGPIVAPPGPPPPVPPGRPTTVAKTDLLGYIRARLNDPNGLLWTDAQLTQQINQAEVNAYYFINLYWVRFPINIHLNVGTYDLTQVAPTGYLVKNITRITYRGFKVDMLSQKELSLLSPVYRTQQSRPRWASWQFDGFNELRLYPVPSENLPILDTGLQVFTDINILKECIISAYLYPLETNANFTLPDYFLRRLIKYFVFWKAYAMEGPGQNSNIADYYSERYKQQIEQVIKSNALAYANKDRQLSDVAIQRPWRKHRPTLPPNFGTPVNL